jgi:hypothetical protein
MGHKTGSSSLSRYRSFKYSYSNHRSAAIVSVDENSDEASL